MTDRELDNAESNHDKDENVSPIVIIGWCLVGILAIWFVINIISPQPEPLSKRRRPEVMNRMKDLALAQKNHASQSEGRFSAPTHFNSKGEPVFGWYTRLLLLLDNAALYDKIDFEKPYTDPANAKIFKTIFPSAMIPDFEPATDSQGFGLIHYTINSRLFPESGPVTEEEIANSDGLGNTILMAEIQEGLPAWGASGYARDPALGLKPGPNTMGVSLHEGVTVISFADGRAVTINNDIDPEVLKKLATSTGLEPIYEHEY